MAAKSKGSRSRSRSPLSSRPINPNPRKTRPYQRRLDPLQPLAKGFMAPTISAALKFTPRKRVLVDRNETSNKKSKPCKKVTFSEVESVLTDSSALGVESKVVQSPIDVLTDSSALGVESKIFQSPIDVLTDSSALGVESKDYLSLRPQFIRYEPNPIVKMLVNKENGMDFALFEYSLMDEMSEDSADMVITLDEEIEADEILEELVGSDGKKPRRVARFMCFSSLVLILLLAVCVSVSVRAPSLYEQSRDEVASARSSVAASFAAPVQFINLSERVESIEEDQFEEDLNSGSDYTAWAANTTFNLGDYLILNTDTNQTVIQTYNKTTYSSCTIDDALDGNTFQYDGGRNKFEAETEMKKSQVDIYVDNTETESSVITLAITCLFSAVVGVAPLAYKLFPGSSSKVVQVVPVESKERDDGGTRSSSNTMSMEQEDCHEMSGGGGEIESSERFPGSSSEVVQVVPVESKQREMSGGGGEVESSERKARRYSKRELLGSFTTYKRIPIKANGNGIEGRMTQVRRSSRIRKRSEVP